MVLGETIISLLVLTGISGIGAYTYKTEYFQVPLDHFSFAVNSTFRIKYLINDSHWRKNDGPIFFYTGNEGDIESFANNTGFMWENAAEFGAMVVFGEHRFYGESFPDNFTYNFGDNSVIGYLNVEQALADYADLLTYIKKSYNANSCVISFGGSYGGQLTAYFRIKYPHIVQGGIASSAPLFLTEKLCEVHDKSLRAEFSVDHPECSDLIRISWGAINNVAGTDDGKEWLSLNWKLCEPIETADNVTTLKSWLNTMYSNLGMVNYPYPASFIRNLPGRPVKAFCEKLFSRTTLPQGHHATDKNLLQRLFSALNVYFNYTGSTSCFDYTDTDDTSSIGFSTLDAQSFDFQSCTELIDPYCDDGVQDFFEPSPWNVSLFVSDCLDQFNVTPQVDRIDLIYGGKRILAASNIIFSNGLLDPWHGYGVLHNLSNSLIAIVMDDTAHHLDLRASNPLDPPSVVAAREFEKSTIKKWIKEFYDDEAKIKQLVS